MMRKREMRPHRGYLRTKASIPRGSYIKVLYSSCTLESGIYGKTLYLVMHYTSLLFRILRPPGASAMRICGAVVRSRTSIGNSGVSGVSILPGRSISVLTAPSSSVSSSSATVPWRWLMMLSMRRRGGPELRRSPFLGGPAVTCVSPRSRIQKGTGSTYIISNQTV